MPIANQAEEACKWLLDHPVFGTQQISLFATSQGVMVARHVIVDCNLKYPIRNFVSHGGPLNGHFFEEKCDSEELTPTDDNIRCYMQQILKFNRLPLYSNII